MLLFPAKCEQCASSCPKIVGWSPEPVSTEPVLKLFQTLRFRDAAEALWSLASTSTPSRNYMLCHISGGPKEAHQMSASLPYGVKWSDEAESLPSKGTGIG